MFIDPQKRLWLLWPTILANRWETALMKYRISADYQKAGPPKWGVCEVLHVTPGTNFQKLVNAGLDELAAGPGPLAEPGVFEKPLSETRERAADKLLSRLG